MSRWSWIAVALGAAAIALPESSLAVRRGNAWRVWWTSRTAPVRWQPRDTASLGPVAWRTSTRGVEWAELVLAGRGEAWRTRVVVARLDSKRVRLRLDTAFTRDGAPTWTIERARATDAFAVNAGQFLRSMPWGQVVLDGNEWLAAGHGPMSSTVAIDATGDVHITHGERAATPRSMWAFQSYPTLLRGGEVPFELQASSRGIDVGHRDARAAIGVTADGRVLVALTRFDALGATLGFIPFGLTTPEMAAVMGALGARDAVMLDGGISGQMVLRDASGETHAWRGARSVPLALVAEPRSLRDVR